MSKRPLLLDLFCGAGGCAVGYHRAGFDVVGVDHKPQKRYPFPFIQADALRVMERLLSDPLNGMSCKPNKLGMVKGVYLSDVAAIHASPPCQAYSAANNIHGRTDHPDLIAATRELLIKSGKLWVIENVERSPLQCAAVVCGLALGLNVRRHRGFEGSVMLFGTGCGDHTKDYVIVFGGSGRARAKQVGRTAKGGPILRRATIPVAKTREAMGIDWMSRDELSQAIPPAYTEFIGRQLIRFL